MPRKPDLKQIDRIVKEVGGLTRGQRELLHRAISRQQLTLAEIKKLAEEIKDLFPNK